MGMCRFDRHATSTAFVRVLGARSYQQQLQVFGRRGRWQHLRADNGAEARRQDGGQVEKLMSVKLMPVDKTITDCKVQDVVEDDPGVPVTSWRFTCQVNVGKQNSRYTFGISAQFGNGETVTRELTGGLYGAWVDSTNLELAMPLPAQLDAAFPRTRP